VAAVVSVGLLAGCSDDPAPASSSTTKTPGSTAGTSRSAASSGPVKEFKGTDAAFYVPPDPLTPGAPGELIRKMTTSDANGQVTVKIMYHSRDAQDRDRPVTGLVTYPKAKGPADGWPIIATAPGTVGVDAHCGLSHTAEDAPDWGITGVRVMTDYIGLGPVGEPLHPYLSRPSEGHSVIDGVRAARNLPGVDAGDRWFSVGHSQGGHGSLSASELAADYAPELNLMGTVALAPAAMLDKVYGGIDPIVTSVLTAMSLYGGAGEHPEIKVSDYVTPEMAKASAVFRTGCLDEITNELVPLVLDGKMFAADPRTTEPAQSLLLQNDVGNVAVDAPLFLASGTADERVAIQRSRDLFDRLCQTGQVTELHIVEGADHGSIIPETAADVKAFLQARLDGTEPHDSCP